MKELVIRSATPDDAEALLEIYSYYVTDTAINFDYEPPTVDEFREKICNILEKYPYLVAEREDRIRGFAYAGPFVGRAAYAWSSEVTIYLAPEEKGRGTGRKLYENLERRLKERGIRNLYACIGWTDRPDRYLDGNSAGFHGHLGYTKVGHFRKCGYKFGRWYDMIWMEKIIGEHRMHDTDCKEGR